MQSGLLIKTKSDRSQIPVSYEMCFLKIWRIVLITWPGGIVLRNYVFQAEAEIFNEKDIFF